MNKIFTPPFKNIRSKTALFVLLLLIITTVIFYIVTANIMKRHFIKEIITRAESLSANIAATAGFSFSSQDILGLDNIVFKIKESNPDIEYIAIVDTLMNTVVHSDIKKSGEKFEPSEGNIFKKSRGGITIKEISGTQGKIFELVSPVYFLDKHLGSVILGINKSVLFNALGEAQKKIMFAFTIILFLGIASSVLLSSLLTKPIQELSNGVAELKEGKKRRPLRIYSRDELGRLTESFNEMTALITAQGERLSKYAQDLEDSYVSTVKVLAAAIDARDHYTLGHSTRVAQLSVQLGKEIGLSEKELEEIEIACLFHDVGKIRIPDSILLKQNKLNHAELDEMRRHPEYGTEILSKAPSLLKYIPAVRHHHECFDGSGYPNGLKGDKIPLAAAIISLADFFDAMTSERPYRAAFTEEETLGKIEDSSKKRFDPHFIEIFVRLFKKKRSKLSS
jgi:HD-GYP domain-containing protein (c-di-GMP phosphodiesterase class II)